MTLPNSAEPAFLSHSRRKALRQGLAFPALAALGHRALAQEERGLDALARRWLQANNAPGLQVAFAKKGQTVFSRAYGWADSTKKEALDQTHIMRIASVSKPITSAAIFVLVERGKLKLSDKVLGEGGLLKPNVPQSKLKELSRVTIHHLLTHTSGVWIGAQQDPVFQAPEMAQAQLIDEVITLFPVQAAPGQRYAYSNFGYLLLGRVIEKITQQPYEQAVKNLVLQRCGISGMRIGGNRLAEKLPNEVSYFGQAGEDAYSFNLNRMDAHGGWVANASDLLRLANHLDLRDNPKDILSSASLNTMLTPIGPEQGYACGWAVNSAQNWWHAGSLPGTTALLVRTASGMTWAALTNTRTANSSKSLDDLLWNMAKSVTSWEA